MPHLYSYVCVCYSLVYMVRRHTNDTVQHAASLPWLWILEGISTGYSALSQRVPKDSFTVPSSYMLVL